jgi:SAM-dependent methyltransferase
MSGDIDCVLRRGSERARGSRVATLRRVLEAVHSDDGNADAEFDHAYPRGIRAVSARFWTPVRVAVRAAELLVKENANARILDIGSGVGKFCIVGAAATGATFVGVEHRARLVSMATLAAEAFGVETVRFQCTTFDALDVRRFDGIYLFNPFEENLSDPSERLDETVPLSWERFASDTVLAERMLAGARPGTRVVTYNGFGSPLPPGFRLTVQELHGAGHLELWEKSEELTSRQRGWRFLSWIRLASRFCGGGDST